MLHEFMFHWVFPDVVTHYCKIYLLKSLAEHQINCGALSMEQRAPYTTSINCQLSWRCRT